MPSAPARSLKRLATTSPPGRLRLGLHRFELQRDRDLVAHVEPAREGVAVVDAEIATVNLRLRLDAEARVAPWVFDRAFERERERHRFRHALQSQIAVEDVGVVTFALDTRAFEGHRRVLLYLEEVSRAQVLVARLDLRIDRRDLRAELDRGLGHVLVVVADRALELLEAALNPVDLKVPAGETDEAVRRVDLVI